MAEPETSADETDESEPKKKGKAGLLIVGLLGLLLAGGGFYAAFSGMLDAVLPQGTTTAESHDSGARTNDVATPTFMELEPMVISVGGEGSIRQLRFRAFLELANGENDTVAALQPRILDIFATYLRAVSVSRLEDPTSLIQLRAQLLRRVQLLVGPDNVQDLLIIDFVIT